MSLVVSTVIWRTLLNFRCATSHLKLKTFTVNNELKALTHGIRAINRTKQPNSEECNKVIVPFARRERFSRMAGLSTIDYCAMRVARKRHPGTHRIHNVTRTWKLTWQFIYSVYTMRQCL